MLWYGTAIKRAVESSSFRYAMTLRSKYDLGKRKAYKMLPWDESGW